MSELLKDVTQSVKVYTLSRKPVIGAVVGAIVAVAVPTLIHLKGTPVPEVTVKAAVK